MLRNKEIATAGSTHRRIGHLNVWHILWFGILSAGLVFCSKQHDAPVAFHETLLGSPSDLQAQVEDGQRVVLTWRMADDTNVAGFVVSLSDTLGLRREALVKETAYSIEESSLSEDGFADSTWFFFLVSAVDDSLFRGPAARLDTVFVFQ